MFRSMFLVIVMAVFSIGQRSYYISSEGSEEGDGSMNNPFSHLVPLNGIEFHPGDSILFRCGDRFEGHLELNGSGSADNPVVLSSYGTGEKPLISGASGSENGGDYREAIYVQNCDHIHFENLEIQNERVASREGVGDEIAYGIHIHNSGSRVLENFRFQNITFQNVYAPKPVLLPEDFNKLEVAALRISTDKNSVAGQEKHIRDLIVEDCYFTDLQRLGVHVKHAGGAAAIGNDSINRNMDLIFRNNTFSYIGGTCILPSNTYNTLIEDNIFDHPGSDTDPRMPGRGSSVWPWRCRNTVIQRNKCLSIRGYLDSHGIHIDHENRNTFIQYNYMEDCEGGFVEILGGNVNAVYRFNISVNDGWRENPNWKFSNHTIWINQKAAGNKIEYCDSSYIYNNTIVIDRSYSTCININAKNTFIFNNIFYTENGGEIGGKKSVIQSNNTPLVMTNNLYYGAVSGTFVAKDTDPVQADPLFTGDLGDESSFSLSGSSPALTGGVKIAVPPVPGAGSGVFTDVQAFPAVDYFGTTFTDEEYTNIGAALSQSTAVTEGDRGVAAPVKFFPADRSLTLSLPVHLTPHSSHLTGKIGFSLFTHQGRKIAEMSKDASGNKISFNLPESLSAGVYIMSIKMDKFTQSRQIVIN